jgi:hypothetical protein
MPIRDIKAKMAHHIAAVTPGLVQLLLRGYLETKIQDFSGCFAGICRLFRSAAVSSPDLTRTSW